MIGPNPDLDQVTAIVREVSDAVILPRFRNLRAGDIEHKSSASPGDLVTVADREAELRLAEALLALTPGVTIVGEEATHTRPDLLDQLAFDAPLWVIDPIDGTRNFCSGNDRFGVMVSWIVNGTTQAAWVHLPARGLTFTAERSRGCFCNGARVSIAEKTSAGTRGSIHTRYMPPPLGAAVQEALASSYTSVPDAWSAAIEYTDVVRGERDFVVYYRLLPWDHAAPALIVSEAGGRVEHLDGAEYTPRSPHQITIAARSADVALEIRKAMLIEGERRGGPARGV